MSDDAINIGYIDIDTSSDIGVREGSDPGRIPRTGEYVQIFDRKTKRDLHYRVVNVIWVHPDCAPSYDPIDLGMVWVLLTKDDTFAGLHL